MSTAPFTPEPAALAVLVSGGVDSAVLLAESLNNHAAVIPLYVCCGHFWEAIELACLRRFLNAIRTPALQPVHVLEMPVRDLYDRHWSLSGNDVPDGDTPDEAVFLPGRNVLLLSKAILWCHLHSVPAVALAPLEANPFPDATPEFFAQFSAVVNQAISGNVRVLQPYRGLHKADVIRRGQHSPLELTFSCIRPTDGRHCGRCNKCAERRRAFADAEITDKTEYVE